MTGTRLDRVVTLLVIRHGETRWNAEGRFRGCQDIDLNARGRRQAAALARRLVSAFPIHHVYSSPLRRCLNTARPLARALGLSLVVEPALTDLCFGEWEGMSIEEAAQRFPQEYTAWLRGDPSFRPPGGESTTDAAARLQTFIDDIVACHQGETVAVVTHEIICQIATCLFLGMPLDRLKSVRHDNAAISVFAWGGAPFPAEGSNLFLSAWPPP
jgi:broad specificity phosphatase PhoE